MPKVIVVGWREGLKKVTLTKLHVDILGKSLKESKLNVDSLLDGKKIVIEIDTLDLAHKFLTEADRIGVTCTLEE